MKPFIILVYLLFLSFKLLKGKKKINHCKF